MNSIKNIAADFLQLLFPHVCAGCGTGMANRESPLCIRCTSELPLTHFHLHANNPVEKLFWGRLALAHATSYCYFTKASLTRQLLHQLKYKNNKDLGLFLGGLMGNALGNSSRFTGIDVIVPLPLFFDREKKRGYNQAALLSRGIAGILQVPVIENAVVRLSASETQTQKNRIERWQNMEGRFSVIRPDAIRNRHILLVDDVVTTGATLEACGNRLLQTPGTRLSVATLACTV
jgi:ComF family protein